jgi:hypothetical protein
MLASLHRELAHCITGERLRRAEVRRAAGRGPGLRAIAARVRWRRRRAAGAAAEIRVRFATERDRATWPDLEWQTPEQVLVADYDGAPRAALSLVDGAVVAVAHDRETSRGGPTGPPLASRRFERPGEGPPASSGSDRS